MRRDVRWLALVLLLGGSVAVAATQTSAAPAARWWRALDAWDAGRYPAALEDLRALMQSPSAAEYRDRVALLTGELFVTTELTTDGRSPRVSTTGRYISYETGPTARVVTRVVTVTNRRVQSVAELSGSDAALDSTETRVAWLRPKITPEWTHAEAAVDVAGSAQERTAAQTMLTYLLSRDGELVVRDLASGAERVWPTAGLLKTSRARAWTTRSATRTSASAICSTARRSCSRI
jgi:hypothetical protein